MAKSLLDKALEIKSSRVRPEGITVEEIELALAWLTGVVSTSQVAKILGFSNTGNCYSRIAIMLKRAYQDGHLKVK
jgi:hypothetical protein